MREKEIELKRKVMLAWFGTIEPTDTSRTVFSRKVTAQALGINKYKVIKIEMEELKRLNLIHNDETQWGDLALPYRNL